MIVIARLFAALLLLATLHGCFAPISPAQRASDAARDLNIATRFGKMDLVAGYVAASFRPEFLARRAQWGRELRVVDLEMTGVQVQDSTHAVVTFDVSWFPLRDGILRGTHVEQRWQDDSKGWKLVGEQSKGGDSGLFGELLVPDSNPHPDVHLPSRTLGSPDGY
jgi:hypothetical protein